MSRSLRAYTIGRNGMPEPVPYVYRGTGDDQLTGHLTPSRVRLEITAAEGIPYTGYDTALSEVPGAGGRKPGDRR